LPAPHIVQEPLQGWTVDIATGEATIIVFSPQQAPAGMGLAADIGL
jgi:hypothetical protein